MARQVQKVRGRTAAWLTVVAVMVLAGVSVGQLASASTSGGGGTTTTTKVKPTTTTKVHHTTTSGATSTSGATTTSGATSTSGSPRQRRDHDHGQGDDHHPGDHHQLDRRSDHHHGRCWGAALHRAASLPMLFGALALLGLGGASLLAGSRRRRRA